METYRLTRSIRNDAEGTVGIIENESRSFGLYTLELPWNGNIKGDSCIPTGTYTAYRSWYHKHNMEVYELRDVPDRSEILIHIGNYLRDTHGCILLGMSYDEKIPAVWSSRKAFNKFMAFNRGVDEFSLRITNAPDTSTDSTTGE